MYRRHVLNACLGDPSSLFAAVRYEVSSLFSSKYHVIPPSPLRPSSFVLRVSLSSLTRSTLSLLVNFERKALSTFRPHLLLLCQLVQSKERRSLPQTSRLITITSRHLASAQSARTPSPSTITTPPSHIMSSKPLTLQQVHEIESGCHALIPGIDTAYGYVPSLAAGVIFCVLFGLSLCGHIFQAVRKRRWTSYVLAAGAITEIIGWAGRTGSSQCPYSQVSLSSLLPPPFHSPQTHRTMN